MSENFDKSFVIVLGEEVDPDNPDKVTNDPNDPGGETKYGVSKRQYPLLDIKNLTLDHAKMIYKADYWNLIDGDELPWPLCVYVLDAAVNQGVGAAVRMLQHALDTVQDGILGRNTLRLAKASREWHWHRFMAFRAMRYQGTRNFDHNGEGWLIRLFNVVSKA